MPRPDEHVAAQLRGFGPAGLLAIVVIVLADFAFKPLSAILVLLWAQQSHTPWRELGFVRPRSWFGILAVGIVFGVVFKLVMKAVVMPLLGADPINHAYQYVVGNPAALPGILYAAVIGAAFGEEIVFRGYFFERLGKLLGTGTAARVAIVLLTSGLFGLAHFFNQGLPGVLQGTITGLVFGAVFAATGRIWTLIFAHAAFNLTAIAIIYWNMESAVASFLFD